MTYEEFFHHWTVLNIAAAQQINEIIKGRLLWVQEQV